MGVFCLHSILIFPFSTQSSNLADPEISATPNSISGLSYYFEQGPSHSASFTITANNLLDEITIKPPSGFEISTDNSTFQNISIILPQTTTYSTIYTRLKHNQKIDNYNGNIEISSAGVDILNISLDGEVWAKKAWNFTENFNNSNLSGSYQTDSFIGNNNITWKYANCRDERGYGTHFMKYTKGIKLKDSGSKIYTKNIPKGVQNFQCKLFKGSSSTTLVEVDLYINGKLIASSAGFNDDEMHIFSVEDMNIIGNAILEIGNQKSVSVVIDDITWTNYNDPTSRFIHSSHDITTHIIGNKESSYYEYAAITVHAKNLIGDLHITPPAHYLISADNSIFSSSLTFPMGSGNIQNKNIYIRLDPIKTQRQYSGELKLSSISTDEVFVNCVGATRPTTNTPLIINEVDADTKDVTGTSNTDEYDFIELYTGQPGIRDLSGYVLVLYNGGTNQILKNYSLEGYSSNEQGYFIMGNTAVKDALENYNTSNGITTIENSIAVNNTILQNGPDAVALYYGVGGDFSVGDSITTLNLVDAMVYSLSDDKDHYPTGLMSLLNSGQPYVNENSYDEVINDKTIDKQTNSMGRIANGEGGLRNTLSYAPCIPTPGMENTALLHDGVPTRVSREGNKISIYGTVNTLHITGKDNGQIYIYDLKGALITCLSKTSTNIKTSILPGMYIIKLVDNNNVQTQKVIIPYK